MSFEVSQHHEIMTRVLDLIRGGRFLLPRASWLAVFKISQNFSVHLQF